MLETANRTQGFWKELYKSFVNTNGYFISFLGLVLTLTIYALSSKDTVSLKIALPVSFLFLLCIITLGDMSIRMHGRALKSLPRVKQGRMPPTMFPDAIALLLLEPSNLYGHEGQTSIYYLDEGFEVLAGVGFVLTIQDDRLIQVVVSQAFEGVQNDLWEKVCNNDKNVLPKLMVKPSVPRFLAEGSD